MFDFDDSPDFLKLALRYLMQLLVVCPVVVVATGSVSDLLLSRLGLSGEHPSHVFFGGYSAVVSVFVGIALGWIAGHRRPSLVGVGRWIWVLPATVVFPEIIGAVFRTEPAPWAWIPEVFFATGDNEGLGVFFFLLPTSAACGYSIGMALIGTGSKRAKVTRLIPSAQVAVVSLIWLSLFCVLLLVARRFENSRIEKWGRVGTVVDRSGLSISTDVNQLCATRTSSHLLRSGTEVEKLETRGCLNQRLLDLEAADSTEAWHVVRVRVLFGVERGLEGWVPAYGLIGAHGP
jgi:hypothetical protein